MYLAHSKYSAPINNWIQLWEWSWFWVVKPLIFIRLAVFLPLLLLEVIKEVMILSYELQICQNHMNFSLNLDGKLDRLPFLALLIKRNMITGSSNKKLYCEDYGYSKHPSSCLTDVYAILQITWVPFQFVNHLFSRATLDRPRETQLTECLPGAPCLKVVDMEMGVTTAREFHCSGSWPAWMACVAKCWKLGRKPWGKTSFFCMLSCKGSRKEESEENKTRKLVLEGLKETQKKQAEGS